MKKEFKVGMVSCIVSALFATGCASKPANMSATYISPVRYAKYDCEQIFQEMDYSSQRTIELYNSLNKKADTDTAQMTVGLILFWPALFFLEGGDGPEAAEYTRLKGEYEALRKVSIQQKCENSSSFLPFDQLIKKSENLPDQNTSTN